MPTKKTQDEIFYVEKKVSNTPHPIIVGCGDIFFNSSIIGKQKSIKNSKFKLKIQTPLNNNINGFNINKISDLIYSSKYNNVDELIELLLNNDTFSKNIEVILDFDYFLEKKAPVSNKKSSLLIESSIRVVKKEENVSYYLLCTIPYIASCPVSKEISDELAVADVKLGGLIKEKFDIKCVHNDAVFELFRGIRSQMDSLLGETDDGALKAMQLGLSHSLSRYKLKFSADKVDIKVNN
jgi:hypothetical protein